MYCPECGTESPDNANFCPSCRHNLKKIVTLPEDLSFPDSLDALANTMTGELESISEELIPGFLFADRYEILSEGLKGGMGTVYKCKDTKLDKTNALKVINPKLTESEQAIMRFRQEVAISQDLRHLNIVTVYDIGEWKGREYFTMEWIERETLREMIEVRRKEKSYFTTDEATIIVSQLSNALSYAHKYTVHRDIKPENILVWDKKELNIVTGNKIIFHKNLFYNKS